MHSNFVCYRCLSIAIRFFPPPAYAVQQFPGIRCRVRDGRVVLGYGSKEGTQGSCPFGKSEPLLEISLMLL